MENCLKLISLRGCASIWLAVCAHFVRWLWSTSLYSILLVMATLLFIVIVLRIRALAHNQQIFDLNNQVCEQSEHSITRER